LSVRIEGLEIFANLVRLGPPKDPIECIMLSSKVATICLASGVLALPVRAALASASCRRAVSRSISACWFVTISAVEVSVVGVLAVQEFED
jgi:hypothetical protein